MDLEALVADVADALAAVDAARFVHKEFQAGIGPFGEADAVCASLHWLMQCKPADYSGAKTKRLPDLLIPSCWAVEFKVIRPFGDNGRPAEHWSENVLHPYAGNTSSLGDCLKLRDSPLTERKAIIIFGFEHTPPQVALEPAVRGFELLAKLLLGLDLSPRREALRVGLVHPVHQQLRVFGYEVLAARAS